MLSKEVKAYMAEIGRKGGRAGKGTPRLTPEHLKKMIMGRIIRCKLTPRKTAIWFAVNAPAQLDQPQDAIR